MHKSIEMPQMWMRVCWNFVQSKFSRGGRGLNISQQAKFMLQMLDYGGRHHHAVTKASERPSLKTLIPQKTAIFLGEVHHVWVT